MPPLVIPERIKKHGGARIYDAPGGGAQIYDAPQPIKLLSLTRQMDLPIPPTEPAPPEPVDLTITLDRS